MAAVTPAFAIAPLTESELPAALALQAATYPAFLLEDEAAFASRLRLAASHSLAATRDGVLLGYLLAHGWRAQSPPPVGAVLSSDGGAAAVLYVHDLAVAAGARGLGVGRALVDRAFAAAARAGIGAAELIAVEGADGFWRGLGFADAPLDADLRAKVATYGARARWMRRALP